MFANNGMFDFLRKKLGIIQEEPIKEYDVGQVTVILNGRIFDNFITHNDIDDWKYNQRIIIPPFSQLNTDGDNSVEYSLKPDVTETFTRDHEHVVLHCTVQLYLVKEIMAS